MSRKIMRRYRCPTCGHAQDFEQWDTINVTLNPELKAPLLSHQLTTFKCARCNRATPVEHNLLYHDMGKHFMVWLMGYNVDGTSLAAVATLLAQAARGDKYKLRRVHSFNDLIEKVLVLSDDIDDRVTELFKATLPQRLRPQSGRSSVTLFCLGRSESSNDRLLYRLHLPPTRQTFEVPIATAQELFDDITRDLPPDTLDGEGPWQLIDKNYAARAFNKRGLNALESYRDVDLALNCFNRALTLMADDPILLANKASALGAMGRYGDAIEALDLALRLDAGN